MSAFSAFYDHILPELDGCTTANVDLHLLLVARDFCERTRCWRVDFTAVDTVADQAAYTLVIGVSATQLVAVHKLTVNDTLLYNDQWRENVRSDSDATDAEDEPEYDRGDPPFTISADLATITLSENETPGESSTGGLEITGSIQPSLAATTLPDFLLNRYAEAMRTGVLARLMAQANRPWSAPAQSALYRSDYERFVQLAAAQAQRGNQRALLRTRPH